MEYPHPRQPGLSSPVKAPLHSHLNWRRILLCIWLLFSPGLLAATPDPEVLVVTSGSEQIYKQVIAAFANTLRTNCKQSRHLCTESSYKVLALDRVNETELHSQARRGWRLIVTVGHHAANKISDLHPTAPVLYSLIPHNIYRETLSANRTSEISAIFVDQPVYRRLSLLKEAMPKRTRVGVLTSRFSQDTKKEIARLAGNYGLKPKFVTLEAEEQLGSVLKRLLDQSDVLLAIPDPLIFNRNTVRNVLLSSYHHRTPVVGFSAAYVKAGAIVAVYSTPDQIGRQIGEAVATFLENHSNRLPPPAYPKYFSVACNQNVSNSLQINLPTSEQLEMRLRELSK